MRTYDASTLASLDAGRWSDRGMVLFDMEEGLFGFWTGIGDFEYGGVTYKGVGRLISMSAIESGSDGAPKIINATMSAEPNAGLTPDVLGEIWNYNWSQRPVIISTAYLDPDTNALQSVERDFSGYFDHLEEVDEPSADFTLEAVFESKARDHRKKGARRRSDADQTALAGVTDKFYEHAGLAGSTKILWGPQR